MTGIRQLNTGDNSDANFLKRFSGAQQPSALDRLQLDARDLQSMRQQLKSGGALKDSGNKPLSVGGINGTPLGKPLNAPIDAPINGSLAAKPINGSVTVNPFGGNFNADVGTYNRVIGAPEEQSPVYNELKKRLEVYQQDRRTPTEKNAERFNQQLAAKNAAAKLASSGRKPGDIALPEANIKPGTVVQPMPVKTLSEGIAGKGLKDILAKAESLMKEGKYTSAIDQYSIGEQVAPNQPLIWIGRANAELGAAFYQRADIHLRQAFNSDKALLMAQYDLRTFFGADRLATVIKDLQDIASADQQSTTPVFLLAYISYNTANESRAAGYLDLAEKRSEGKDPIYRLLREHWTLPETEGAQKLPKPETKLPEIPKADGAPTIPENK